jgi:hypothetical protein
MTITRGLAAGLVGTAVLNATTYLDMAVRGRAASSVPGEDVERMAGRLGISLGEGETAENRREAIGVLLGYAAGMTAGAAYALLRPHARPVPEPLAAAAVAAATMAATDGMTAALGASDPRSWSAADWVTDIVPHLAFGLAVVKTEAALQR